MRMRVLVPLTMAALTACSLPLKTELFNNSNVEAQVLLFRGDVVVHPGGSAVFNYPGDGTNWRVRLKVKDCLIDYEVPRRFSAYSKLQGFDGVVKLQLEESLDISLLLPNVAKAGGAVLAPDDFPVRPVSRVCSH